MKLNPSAKSYTNPTGRDNWIKSDWLKQLLGIKHPLITAYIRQIPVIHYKTHDEYQGTMQFHFRVPNKFHTEQPYTFAWILDAYGDLRGAIYELYQIATKLWEPCYKRDWDRGLEATPVGAQR